MTVTQADIARQLGISQSTVSKVLAARGGISGVRPAVAAQVRELAELLGCPMPSVGGRGSTAGGGTLSPQEVELLALAAEGYGNAAIASALHISINTVKTHLRHAYDKLGAADRTHAVVLAMRTGQLQLHPEVTCEGR